MPLLTTITNAAWPTSGTPTAGNSGFAAISSGGTLAYEVDDDGETYITTTAIGQSLSVRIDATSAVFASSETRYHCEIVVYAEFTGQSGSTNIGTPSGFAFDYNNAGARATLTFNAGNNVYNYGLFPSAGAFNGAAAGNQISGISREVIPVNRKFNMQMFADKTGDATNGFCGILINGVRMNTWTDAVTANWDTSVTFSLPATAGIRWRIYASPSRPCRSYTGNDHEFTPLYDDYGQDSDGLAKAWPHIATDGLMGNLWSYSGAVTLTEFETTGLNPCRKRMIGGSGGVTATSKLSIGTLPYNRFGDSAIITTFYVPSGGTASIVIRDAEDTEDVIKFQIDGGEFQDADGTQLLASDGTAVSIADDKRYGLVINLSRDGNASWTVLNMSDDHSSRTVWSNAMNAWEVQSLGPIVLTASETSEWDRVDICRFWSTAISNSLAVAYTATVSPRIASSANNFGYGFPHSDALAIPGIAHHNGESGWPKDSFMLSCGRSGGKHSEWASGCMAYMTYTKAMRIVALDSGCWNDINTDTTAVAMLALVQADFDFAKAHNSEYVQMPCFERPMGLASSMTAARATQRRKFNDLLEAWARSNASSDNLFWCDHTRAYQVVVLTTDGVHPSASNDACTRAIAASYQSAAQAFRNGQPGRQKRKSIIRL